MDGDKQCPIERFDPLLRNLVSWNLVTRGTRPHSWRLTEAAQRRLEELAASTGPVTAERMVYLDHFCADCHLPVRTRVYEGLYLCESCIERRAMPPDTEPPLVAKRRWRRHRRRVDGSTPVAS